MENKKSRGVLIDYLVTGNLGNEYNVIDYKVADHSTDFKQDHLVIQD